MTDWHSVAKTWRMKSRGTQPNWGGNSEWLLGGCPIAYSPSTNDPINVVFPVPRGPARPMLPPGVLSRKSRIRRTPGVSTSRSDGSKMSLSPRDEHSEAGGVSGGRRAART